MAQRSNAALYYQPHGYTTSGPQLMGIQAASEGLLRAMATHAGVERLYAFCEGRDAGDAFAEAVRGINPKLKTEWIPSNQAERLAAVQTLQLPGPGLSAFAWIRRRIGSTRFSLCGVTHTTATPLALDAIADLLVAPVEPWDALICTSRAVRSMVSTVLEDQRRYLEERFGRIVVTRPQLPVIPLGVDAHAFSRDPGARALWRAQLNITEAETAFLFVGRLNPIEKAHPIPLFLALAAAARRTQGPLHLILAGWFAHKAMEEAYRQAAAQFCPDVRITIVDGRERQTRSGVWQAADIFISPVDNIQETFGLSPVEAMAAGLPVIASEWDGYRDTVRHGVDGLLVRTLAPPPGSSTDLSKDYSARRIDYERYVGVSSQAVAVDVNALINAIVALADNPHLREAMGADARRRAHSEFDWSRIIPRYQSLWTSLGDRRRAAPAPQPSPYPHPARPEPFRAFASYPTEGLGPSTTLSIGVTAPAMIEVLLNSPLVSFAGPSLPPLQTLLEIVRRVEQGPMGISQSITMELADMEPITWRGIAWLLKFGFLQAG